MAKKLGSKEIVTTDEIAYSNMLPLEALYKLLLKKGIITKKEYLD
jgi:hypothetical protein